MTQQEQISDHLLSGRTLTPAEALRLYGCFRLASRIYDLRHKGYNIVSKLINVGTDKTVSEYRLG